jgi:hypothetical protein
LAGDGTGSYSRPKGLERLLAPGAPRSAAPTAPAEMRLSKQGYAM